jgi:hypothetical protein
LKLEAPRSLYSSPGYNNNNQILSWQKDVGCYGTMKKITDKPTDFLKSIIKDYEYSEENNQRDKVLKFAEKSEQNKTTMNKNSKNTIIIYEKSLILNQ